MQALGRDPHLSLDTRRSRAGLRETLEMFKLVRVISCPRPGPPELSRFSWMTLARSLRLM
eukprot:6550571-Pyramimonas_sp.AAC.1